MLHSNKCLQGSKLEVWQISWCYVWASSLHRSSVPPWREMLPSLIYVSRGAAKFLLLQQLNIHSLFQKHVWQFQTFQSDRGNLSLWYYGRRESDRHDQNMSDTKQWRLCYILRCNMVISFWVWMLSWAFRYLWAGILPTADYSENDWVVVIVVTSISSIYDRCVIVLRLTAALLCSAVH